MNTPAYLYSEIERNYLNSSVKDKEAKKNLMLELLDSLKYKYKSNNKNIHIQIRNSITFIDVWPTTDKLQLNLFGEIVIFNGKEKVLNALIYFAELD